MSDIPPATEPRPYDFSKPVRILADSRQRLEADQQSLAALLGPALGERLGTGCDLTFQSLGEGASERVFATAYDPVFRLAPFTSGGTVLVRIGAEFAQALVDRLLGGVGASREVAREPTEIEAALLAIAADAVRGALAASWNVKPGTAHAAVFVTAEERHATTAVEGASGVFEVRMGDASGPLELFYSHGEVSRALGLDAATPGKGGTLSWQHVEDVSLQLRVQWPPTPIRIRDLAALQVGDVVHMDHKLGGELLVMLGERIAFRGHPGAVEESFGVCITRSE